MIAGVVFTLLSVVACALSFIFGASAYRLACERRFKRMGMLSVFKTVMDGERNPFHDGGRDA